MKFKGPAKLVDATEEGPIDPETGNPTRVKKGRPEYIVMIARDEYEAQAGENNPLASYEFVPDYFDDCWAGSGDYSPLDTTVYLKFTVKQEAEAKLARWLVVE